jgi:hypothetical protein
MEQQVPREVENPGPGWPRDDGHWLGVYVNRRVLSAAATLIALVNNGTYQWIDMPIELAIMGLGLRVEAAILMSRPG